MTKEQINRKSTRENQSMSPGNQRYRALKSHYLEREKGSDQAQVRINYNSISDDYHSPLADEKDLISYLFQGFFHSSE